MIDELTARNLGHDRPVVCLMDGERALWDAQGVYFPEAVGILDLFHVLERLWAVAHCFHPRGATRRRSSSRSGSGNCCRAGSVTSSAACGSG